MEIKAGNNQEKSWVKLLSSVPFGQTRGRGQAGEEEVEAAGHHWRLPERHQKSHTAQSEKVCPRIPATRENAGDSWKAGCLFRIFLQVFNLVPGQRRSCSSSSGKITGCAVQIGIHRGAARILL